MEKNLKSQPIIGYWELRNFQSIRGPEELYLKPLTIFSGPNSSGKSAIIKSLLMVAQSLDSSVWEVPLVLNGKYTQLGDFDHILHHGSVPPEIEFCFQIRRQEKEIKVQVLIKNEGSMRVKKNTITIFPDPKSNKGETWFRLEHDPPILGNTENQEASQMVKEQIKRGLFNYKIIRPENIESHSLYEKTVSASLSNFLPGRPLTQVVSEIRDITEEFEQARQGILSLLQKNKTTVESVDWDKELSKEANAIFSEVYKHLHEKKNDNEWNRYRDMVYDILNANIPWTIGSLKQHIESKLTTIEGRIRSLNTGLIEDLSRRMSSALSDLHDRYRTRTITDAETSLEVGEFPSKYGEVIQQIRQIFGNQIFYLGPLRDDPRTIYAIPPLPNQRDVGLKGEYTAAMLNVHRQLPINYPLPPSEEFNGRYCIESGELGDAVQIWLERMGLADSFKTEMISKVGYQLEVRPKEAKEGLDLMSLGVGVSQVLPMIVMALLAPEDSVLIFEQPEVHLHPKVQSVLGDFFLGIVGCGKQCIVETHSEHLINRIRRRIAESEESEDTNILEQLQIYFVKLEGGVSQFEDVKPNKYGAIMEWPSDFFDEAAKESSVLVRAGMKKRRKSVQTA